MKCLRERGSIFVARVAQRRKASGGDRREPGVPTKRAGFGTNSNDNCGVKGSRVVYGELSLSVFLSRREDGAERKET